MLDVGCGDGLLAHLMTQKRPDLDLRGIDVLVRDRTHIPVDKFDGQVIPMLMQASMGNVRGCTPSYTRSNDSAA